ncbi:hypothetical protein [Actinophytocola sp.]|uniref:hypothetical protein n=1 Tax=Actinophytocola sp. TaxID=1872138 RepID=UPI002ED31426
MPDLDTSLHELRDDLRRTLTRPDLSHVADRARQRTVRRRMQLGAIVAVVLVSAAVPALRLVQSDSQPPAQPPAAPAPYTVDFADADHGYAFQQHCEDNDGPCVFALRATDDGARTWRRVSLPESRETFVRGMVSVMSPKGLGFSRAKPGLVGEVEQFVSDDGGRTWHDRDVEHQESPTLIPARSQTVPMCVSRTSDNVCVIGVGMLTPLAKAAPVLTQPPIDDPWPGTTATEGGLYWAAGRERTTGTWSVSVTSDYGATWATTPLDFKGLPSLQVDGAWSMTERGSDMYLTVVGNVGVGPTELLAVFRSTDKGVSWARTWQSTEKHELQAVTGDAVLTADGELLVYSRVVGTVASSDGGRTFAKARHQFPGPVRWTRAGYLVTGSNNAFELSGDGLTWRRFEVR